MLKRGVLIVTFYVGGLGLVLFLAYGGVTWTMGWLAIGSYALTAFFALMYAPRGLITERSYVRSDVDRRDVLLATLSFLCFYPLTLLIAGLDRGRYHWTQGFPLWVQTGAFLAYLSGNGLGLWALLSNPFFSTFFRLQAERGQIVIDSGPYRWVRHPGYAGTMIAALALPLALGSGWACLPASAGVLGFWFRTAREDASLLQELPHYADYAERVRYRLVPGLW